MLLQGKNAVITGCNRGIGRAIVEAFAQEGANIWTHTRTETPEFIQDMRNLEQKYSVQIRPLYFDLTDSQTMKEAVKTIFSTKETVDILVNNAGVPHGGLFQMTSVLKIKEVFDINFFAVLELIQLLSKKMVRQKSGSIVNVGSISGLDLEKGNCAYGTSKAALMAATKTLSAEFAPMGIRVNAVAPGPTRTDMVDFMDEDAKEAMMDSSAIKRLADPKEVAQSVLFLASDQASFITGQIIRVDGGRK